MKLGIVSDIHSNLPAFEAVLAHMDNQGVDKKVCLGDIVGYGPYPNECVELAIEKFNFIIKGNHDEIACDLSLSNGLAPLAKTAIEWTSKQLSNTSLEMLAGLEHGFVTPDGYMFIHGSPRGPFEYVQNIVTASNAFSEPIEDFKIAFIGHTHVPEIWHKNSDSFMPKLEHVSHNGNKENASSFRTHLSSEKSIVNVGSVGQPRDRDTRASYAIFDTSNNELEIFRIPYAIERTIGKMQRTNLPMELWTRLIHGK